MMVHKTTSHTSRLWVKGEGQQTRRGGRCPSTEHPRLTEEHEGWVKNMRGGSGKSQAATRLEEKWMEIGAESY